MSDKTPNNVESKTDPKDEGKPASVAILTLATASVAAVNEFTTAFSFAPFWTDIGVSVAVLGTALYFLSFVVRIEKGIGEGQVFPSVRFRLDALHLIAAGLLFVLFTIGIARPIHNALTGEWKVCGSFISTCQKNSCISLYDQKGRKSIEECLPLDASGYLAAHSESWWHYRPSKVAVKCGSDESQAVPIADVMMRRGTCSGVQELRQ